MIIVLLMAVFSAWAFLDVARTPRELVTAPGKIAWGLLVLVPLVGPLGWLLGGREKSASPTRVPVRPVAPDDDPDFLNGLDPPAED